MTNAILEELIDNADGLVSPETWHAIGATFGAELAPTLMELEEPIAMVCDATDVDGFGAGVYQALTEAGLDIALCCIWMQTTLIPGTDERLALVEREYMDPDVAACSTVVIPSPGIFHASDIASMHASVEAEASVQRTILLTPFVEESVLAELRNRLQFSGTLSVAGRYNSAEASNLLKLLASRPATRTRLMPDLVANRLRDLGELPPKLDSSPAPGR